jgi:hydroxyacylglutathione hydrolase
VIQTVSDKGFRLGKIVSRPFEENTYIAYFTPRTDCIVFDPGLEPAAILAYLDAHQLVPAALVCTHGHSDHIAGNAALKQRWPDCPLVIGHGDAQKLIDPQLNLSAAFGVAIVSPPADRTLGEGDRFEAAGFELDVLEAPGHSSGHVVYVCRQIEPWHVFGGDVLFRGSIGRTDFPDGDFDALRRAIHEKLFALPDDTIIHAGHGPDTTVGREKQTNPFVGRPAGYDA